MSSPTKTKRFRNTLLLIFLTGFLLVNGLAFMHARAILHYVPRGTRTCRPEKLSFRDKVRILLTGVTIPRPEDERTPDVLAPDCRETTIPVTGGIRLSAWNCNRGAKAPLVILFHGYSAEKCSLLPEAKAFLELGASVLLVDFRGSGGSSESATTLGVREADDVAAAVRYAQAELPHSALFLFGQSMGSAAILRAVQTSGIHPDGIILQAVFDTMRHTIGNRFQTMGLPTFPGSELLLFWGSVQLGFNGFAHNPVDYAASLDCPVLFMHGTGDPRATMAEGRRVYDSAPEPKTFIEFPGAGHESYVLSDPDRWKSGVGTFLLHTSPTESPHPNSNPP